MLNTLILPLKPLNYFFFRNSFSKCTFSNKNNRNPKKKFTYTYLECFCSYLQKTVISPCGGFFPTFNGSGSTLKLLLPSLCHWVAPLNYSYFLSKCPIFCTLSPLWVVCSNFLLSTVSKSFN